MTDPMELVGRAEHFDGAHKRGCEGRSWTCTCGDDETAMNLIAQMAACIREMVEFNVNNTVWIKVTEHGRKVEADHWASIGLPPPELRVDAGGWEERQLWDVMNIFGGRMGLGLPVPFETTIRLAPPAPGAEA